MQRFYASVLFLLALPLADAQSPPAAYGPKPASAQGLATPPARPQPDAPARARRGKLVYAVEWRLIRAGTATLESDGAHRAKLLLESSGVVSTFYRVYDRYEVNFDNSLCAVSTWMNAEEGKRRRETQVTFDRVRKRATYVERDLVKDVPVRNSEIDIPDCVHDVIAGLLRVAELGLEPGRSAEVPVSDGKKAVQARVEAQAREELVTKAGKFNSIRYEAHLFNGVLYARPARLNFWLTDDARRIPVQIRVRMQFPIGTITLQLEQNSWS